MACQLAVEYKTVQLSAIIAILYDLTDETRVNEMVIEEISHPQLQSPPQANCQRYNQLTELQGEAA